jgi:hypothetical protein
MQVSSLVRLLLLLDVVASLDTRTVKTVIGWAAQHVLPHAIHFICCMQVLQTIQGFDCRSAWQRATKCATRRATFLKYEMNDRSLLIGFLAVQETYCCTVSNSSMGKYLLVVVISRQNSFHVIGS